ncbi:MAG: flagellar hook-associated protein 3 [Spirochaetota bacterium]
MMRVSSDMMGDNLINITKRNTEKLLELQNSISTGMRNRVPRDNPVEVSHSIAYRRILFELGQFEKNIEDGLSRINAVDSALGSATDILQRIRELGIQGANGLYTKEDRAKIAAEINELLEELVTIANSKYKGKVIFAGNDTLEDPFKPVYSFSKEAGKQIMYRVDYYGDIGKQNREISRGNILSVNVPGNEVFWAETTSLFSSVDATNYVLAADSRVRINGVVVDFKAGDNIEMIVNRINSAPLPLRASVNRMNGGIVLETSSARDIWIEDIEGGTLMQDIGVISGKNPPRNLAPTARVFGGTIFDMVMRLRDSLYMNDVEDVGSRATGGIDLALDNLLKYRAELGSKSNRLELVRARVLQDKTNMEDILSKNEDVDVTESITRLKMLEVAHRSALGVTARVIQPTLLDFLR